MHASTLPRCPPTPASSLGRMLLGLSLVLLAAGPASAEGILGAFLGVTFGGKTVTHEPVYGGVLGGVRPGAGLGFAIDFGYSPDFLGTKEDTGVKTSITTVMGNLVFGGGLRRSGAAPYVSGGVGLIRANVSDAAELLDNLSSNDFGFNLGGGINIGLGPVLGLNGDVRYFRSVRSSDDAEAILGIDLDAFDFWRASVGLLVRW